MDVVFTCKGDFDDELLHEKISKLQQKISSIIESDCSVLKVEPWNSIKVTFSIPKKAAKQLRELAQSNSSLLKELDILTVQVQGEDVIKLASSQTVAEHLLHQQSLQHHQDGMQSHIYEGTGIPNAPHESSHLMQPGNPPLKKRRKPKEKQAARTSKVAQNRPVSSDRMPDQVHPPTVLQSADLLNQRSPQFSITQLSPSVEEIVTEAWNSEMHQQHPEEDIMDVQLQSFSSGANVTTGANQAIFNSTFDQPNLQSDLSKQQHSIQPNTIHSLQPELQKQQSVPNNFAPSVHMEQKVFSGQNMGNNLATTNMNPMAHDPGFFNQQMPMQGVSQEISQPQQLMNMATNFPASNLQASSGNQFANAGQQMQWAANSNVQQQQASMFKMQTHNASTSNYSLQQTIQTDISSHASPPPQGNIMSQGHVLSSQPNMAMTAHNAMIMSHGAEIASQGNMVTPSTFMSSQGTMMKSHGSLAATHGTISPAVSGHPQFPFSFPNSVKQQPIQNMAEIRPDKLQVMGQNTSMDSPLLVNLLQTEPPPGATGLASPTQFSTASAAVANQKPKRKKPAKKKKPSKSSGNTTPPGTGPMQAFGGMFPVQSQFVPQPFPAAEMPEQMMPPQQVKMSSQDSKFIDAISRSDVGAQSAGFTNDGNLTSELHSTGQQMPPLRRHNSFPVQRLPQGFDPNKPFPHKPHPNMSDQQIYINQMAGTFPGFKPGHPPRQMMVQTQQMQPTQGTGDNNQMQFQSSNFQHNTPPMSMMQQVARPQCYPVHPRTSPQMQSPGGFSQPMTHPSRGMKTPNTLPTLPISRPVRPQAVQPVVPKRSKFVGRLTTGKMSIMLKSSCEAPTSEHKIPVFPTLHHAQQHVSRAQTALARKSPGFSVEAMSPKIAHPNTPSPHVQHSFGMPSPSPMGAPASGKITPQSRPLSRNFSPGNSVVRRPSLDQFNIAQNQPNHPVNNPPVPSPPVTGGAAVTPPGFHVQQTIGTNKSQESVQPSTDLLANVRNQQQQWTSPSIALGCNPTQYFWKGQATVPTTPPVSTASSQVFPTGNLPPANGTPVQPQPVLEKPSNKLPMAAADVLSNPAPVATSINPAIVFTSNDTGVVAKDPAVATTSSINQSQNIEAPNPIA